MIKMRLHPVDEKKLHPIECWQKLKHNTPRGVDTGKQGQTQPTDRRVHYQNKPRIMKPGEGVHTFDNSRCWHPLVTGLFLVVALFLIGVCLYFISEDVLTACVPRF